MDKELKLQVKIMSAVFDTFNGEPNINCTVQALEGGAFNNGSEEGVKVKRGDSFFATLYLSKTLPPGAREGSETPFARTMGLLRFAGCEFRGQFPVLASGFPNAVIGVFDLDKNGKLRCHYLNRPLTAVAKAPPSRAALDALFGATTATAGGDIAQDSKADDGDIPF